MIDHDDPRAADRASTHPSTRPSTHPSSRRRAAYSLVTLALVGLALHWLAPQLGEIERSLVAMRGLSRGLLAAACGAQIVSYLGSGHLLRAGVALLGERLRLGRAIAVTLAANSVGVAGGSVTSLAMTIRWMLDGGASAQAASLAGTLPFLFNNAILLGLSFAGLIHLVVIHALSQTQEVFVFATAALFAATFGGIAWAVAHRPVVVRGAQRLGRWRAAFGRREPDAARTAAAVDAWFDAFAHVRRGGWRGPLAGALVNIGFDMLTLWLLFRAIGHPVGLSQLTVGYGLPLLLGKAGPLPGGVGVIEGTMALLYGGFGVPYAILVVVILAYRLLSFWLPTLAGFALIPYLNRPAPLTPVERHARG